MRPGLKKWLIDNVVALLALAVSIVALLLPMIVNHNAQSTALRASIVGIQDDDVVSTANRTVAVTYENRKGETDLWLVLRSGVEAKWYPVARLITEHGETSKGEVENLEIELGSTGPFQLSVYATSPSQGKEFSKFLEGDPNGKPAEGLVGLPEGINLLHTVSFTRDR